MNCLENPSKTATLVDLLSDRSAHQPQQTAYTFLVDGEREAVSLTYRELEQKAKAIATYLQSFCSPGERVLLVYPPGLDYIAAFFGCLYAGVVAVPAYPPRPNRSATRLQSIIVDAQAKAALTTKSIWVNLERQFAQTPELKTLYWLATDNLSESLANQWQSPDLTSNSLAFLQYTSGSTAEPKGVMISHGNLLHNLSWIYRCFAHNSHSRGVIWLPPYHDMGLIGGVLQPLYGGFPVVLMPPLIFLQSPIRWLQAISRYQATTSGGPSFAYNLATRKVTPEQLKTLDLSSWEIAFNGAETISYEILEQFATTFEPCGFRREAFYPCYGMAEATLIVSGGLKTDPIITKTIKGEALEKNQIISAKIEQENSRILVSCGQSLSDQQILIVDPETLLPCAPNQVGEIWISGPSIAQGYWSQPEATDSIFNAYLGDTGEGPFLRSGDLGFLDDREVFVTGRLKDMIIINGRNYYPQDIEWTVEQCHSLIRPNCAAGFSVYVEGEEKLVIIAEVDRAYRKLLVEETHSTDNSSQSNGDHQQLSRSIQRAISKNHDLQVYQALLLKPGSIPKTSSGKIQRHVCRQSYLSGSLEVW